jgi:hypothetical protein
MQKDINMSLLEFEAVIVGANTKSGAKGGADGDQSNATADVPAIASGPPGLSGLDSSAFPAISQEAA